MKTMAAVVLSCGMLIQGCASSTSTGVTGVERKQLLLVSEQQVNQASAESYAQMLTQARSKGVLNTNPAQVARVRAIANRLITQVRVFRPEAAAWDWQVNMIKSDDLNAFCAPGGKIMVFSGIVDRLKLSDDEIAAIIGHEIAHALRDHGRENVSRGMAQQTGISILAAATGLSAGQAQLADLVGQIGLSLPNSRTQESEADVVGLELMARAGYDPNAAVSLWRKMQSAGGRGEPPQFLSTHPVSSTRIATIQSLLPRVMPLYQQSRYR